AALRWQPARRQIAPDIRAAYSELRGKKRTPVDTDAQDRGFVWVPTEDGHVRYIEVRVGSSDTVNTEIIDVLNDGELPEKTRLIVGEGRAETQSSNNNNPFIATPYGGKKKE